MAVLADPVALLDGDAGDRVSLTEVELGIGRPDVILVAAELTRLSLRLAGGLRLANLGEAHLLAASSTDLALSAARTEYERRAVRRLAERGWFDPQLREPAVQASILLEAKVSAWRVGVHQLSRVRWGAHRAALVVPSDVARRVPAEHLRRPDIGLIEVDGVGGLRWRRQAPARTLPFFVDAWLGELVIREICVSETFRASK